MQPLIGISAFLERPNPPQTVVGAYEAYLHAIERARGSTLILPPRMREIPRYAQTVDGLLLTGGNDVHPRHFGQQKKNVPMTLSPERRTAFELRLVQYFFRRGIPILGVCLGCQTLNIALGGTILQDIPSQCPEASVHSRGRHLVHLHRNTKLRKILGRDRFHVNTRHHQAIDRAGRDLRTAARAPDNMIEAIESNGSQFLIGVQWHPEEHLEQESSKRLFRAFVSACRRYRRDSVRP